MFVERIKWHKLAASSAALRARVAPGKLAHFKIAGNKVVVGRHKDDFHAFRDRCPHQGASFYGGECTAEGKILCPRHRFTFDLENGRGPQGLAVEVYLLEEREDGLYIGFEYMAFRPFARKWSTFH